jgi:hypothetical protein
LKQRGRKLNLKMKNQKLILNMELENILKKEAILIPKVLMSTLLDIR